MKAIRMAGIVLGLAMLAVAGLAVEANAQKNVRSEVRNVSGFTGVDIGGAMKAEITVGRDYEVIIEAEDEVLPMIVTKVEGDSLVVEFERDWWERLGRKKKYTKVNVTVSLPMLNDLDISGASNAKVTGVNSDSLKIDVSGASAVSIDGNARKVDIDISGASSLKAANLFSDSAEIDASGASSVKVSVTSQLMADASGASSICYSGSPSIQKDVSGASSVKNCGGMP